MASARAGNLALSGVDQTLFDASGDAKGACEIFSVRNRDASTVDAQIKVTPLHGATEYRNIPAGTEHFFKCRAGITKVEGKGNGATVDFSVDQQ